MIYNLYHKRHQYRSGACTGGGITKQCIILLYLSWEYLVGSNPVNTVTGAALQLREIVLPLFF